MIGQILLFKKLVEGSKVDAVTQGATAARKWASTRWASIPPEKKKRLGIPVLVATSGITMGAIGGRKMLRRKQKKEVNKRLRMAQAYRDQLVNQKLGIGDAPTKDLGYTK